MKVNIKKLYNDAVIPTRGSKQAAGYDLYAHIPKGSITIPVGETKKINTGIAIEIPEGYVGLIFPRSGAATNRGLRLANCVGVIDSDYRGELLVALYNDSDKAQAIHAQDRIAQLVIMPNLSVEFEEVDSLEETERGAGGFGSTGISTTP